MERIHAYDFLLNPEKYVDATHRSPIVALEDIWKFSVTALFNEFRSHRKRFSITGQPTAGKTREVIPNSIWARNHVENISPRTQALEKFGYIDWPRSTIYINNDKWTRVAVAYNHENESDDEISVSRTVLKVYREERVLRFLRKTFRKPPKPKATREAAFIFCKKDDPALMRTEFDRAWKRAFE